MSKMINSLKTHILNTSLGDLKFSYEDDDTIIEIEEISLRMQEIVKSFQLSSIWINEQPAHSINGFTASVIRHDNSLIRAEIRDGKLYLFSNKLQFNLAVKYSGQSRTFNVSPQLSIPRLRVLIENAFNCSDFDIYEVDTAYKIADYHTLDSCEIAENTELEIFKLDEEESDQEDEFEDHREGPKFTKDPFVNFQDKKELSFDHQAPKWRTIIRGLNLEGKCLNKVCDAFDKFVCVPLGMGVFPISQSAHAACPYCPHDSQDNKLNNVINCIFWDCMYKIEGMQENCTKLFLLEDQAPSKSALSFAEATKDQQSNIVNWKFLKISTSEILKIEKIDAVPQVSEITHVTGSIFSCVML